jgi:hypothetical protein
MYESISTAKSAWPIIAIKSSSRIFAAHIIVTQMRRVAWGVSLRIHISGADKFSRVCQGVQRRKQCTCSYKSLRSAISFATNWVFDQEPSGKNRKALLLNHSGIL